MVSDRGTEFANKLSRRIEKVMRINRIVTCPYNPRSNGLVEQHNRTLKDQLFHYVEQRQKDWDIFLPTVQLMYNTTVCGATGYTPYYLMFGREANMPEMGLVREGVARTEHEEDEEEDEEEDPDTRTCQEDWVDRLVSSLQLAWEMATDRATENAARGNHHKARDKFNEFRVGERFFRKRNRQRAFRSLQDQETYKISWKLSARWEGPYVVVGRTSAVSYLAEVNGSVVPVHAINMKLCYEGTKKRKGVSKRHWLREMKEGQEPEDVRGHTVEVGSADNPLVIEEDSDEGDM